jgi:hypothetical protein
VHRQVQKVVQDVVDGARGDHEARVNL